MNNDIIMVMKGVYLSIQTKGRWIDGEQVLIIAVNLGGLKVEQKRKVCFDGHDLYIVFNKNRYYYSEFEII